MRPWQVPQVPTYTADSAGPIQLPQPYYDIEIGRICQWLKANGYTMHVKLDGKVTLRKR